MPHEHDAEHPCTCGCDQFGGDTFNVHLQGAAPHHVDYMGRDHIVVPVIMARADVAMNGCRIPLDELFPDAWNGVPVTIGHPNVGNGFSSANDPDIMSNWAIGHIFNSSLDQLMLRGEAWIDVARCEALRPGLVDHLESGEPLDVSTGYFSKKVKSPGVLNGRRYSALDTEINPDHLALLPDEIGACSWDDGCGVRTNKEQLMGEEPTLLERLKDLIAHAGDGKKPYGDVPYADPGYQKDKKKRYPLDTETHIRAAWSYINQANSQKMYSSDQVDKIKAKIVSAWEDKIDKDGPPSASSNARGDDDDPLQVVADLISSDESPFTPDETYALQNLSAETLCNLRDTYLGQPADDDMNTNHREPTVGTETKDKLPTTVGELSTFVQNALKEALPGVLKEAVAPVIAEALKPVTAALQTNALSAEDKAALEGAKKITADHREGVVKSITSNSKMTAEQLKDMTTPQLETIAAGLTPAADFSARSFGGGQLTENAAEEVKADAPEAKAMRHIGTREARANMRAAREKGTVN